ncbi:hypothetical protein [Thalassolituus hydrocarboniclasticus]|uniref:Uncharacterized protein n=1 Tax=Thalassolituus hydrocarboniclasticus TaxID=2742796 RepID=A0ABY6A9S8_9GAMM|nr:hypothetical protein [Thalassolituus hydrocarboniclasticus]UXD87320.1 hypothetical protein HUF19_07705 [Thalassolituus hydrocarboniclasticus]
MKWIGPLFTNAGGWSAYVSYSDGEWYIDKDSPIKIGEGKSGLMLLPIMKKGYGESYERQLELLKAGLLENGFESELAESFPFHVPVIFSFEQRMSRWAEMAAEWVPVIELSEESAQLLFDASQDKLFSQRTRQLLQKAVNSWSKERG